MVSSTSCKTMGSGHDPVRSGSPELDIVIPVFNEGVNIVRVLDSL